MTVSSYKKMLKQLKAKPVKMKKFLKHNTPKEKEFGIIKKACRRCGNTRGHIGKYGLDLCRRCFRDIAPEIGWKKYS